jgi:5-methylcytosine-specific restriction endonuclease McrA
MPIHRLKKLFSGPSPGLSRPEAMKVFRRDQFTCQYCGLDGHNNFANWLVLTIDHIHPHAHGGARKMENQVTACRPCNLMKGTHVFSSLEDAKKYVLAKREEWQHKYKEETKPHAG